MNATTFSHTGAGGRLKSAIQDRTQFINPEDIPWTKFVFEGVEFRILNIDGQKASMMFKVKGGAPQSIHEHADPVELYIIKGAFCYEDRQLGPGGYMYEPAGTVHEPTIPVDSVFITILHGPLRGFDENGHEHVTTAQDYYELAKRNNAVSHLR